jgi:hypothetical protein
MDEMPEMAQGQQMAPQQAMVPTIIDDSNLAKKLKSDTLKEIGRKVVDDYNADLGSRTDFDARRALWRRFFSGMLKPKSYPWPKAANVNASFIPTACLQYQARAFESLIQREIVKCTGVNKDAGDRVANYMNWDLRFGMDDWEEDMDKLLVVQPLDGWVVKKTYRDQSKRRNHSRLLTADEFMVNYKCRRLEDATRKTHMIWMDINEIKKRMKNGAYLSYPEKELMLEPQSYGDGSNMPETKDQVDATDGVSEPQPEFTDRRWVLEQETYLDVNFDPIGRKLEKTDGIERPFVVTVDLESQKVFRIVPLEYWDAAIKEVQTWEAYTDYPFIPNPDSIYALGFGQLIYPLHEAANASINMLLDAGHLNTIISGLIAKRSGVKKGDLRIEMGLFSEVDVMGVQNIKDAIYQFQFKEPSQVLFSLLGLLHDYANEITTKSEWMSGTLPPSDTAATTMIAIIEQGLKVFSVIQKRNHRSLSKELRKLFILNRQYLDEDIYRAVQDPTRDEMKTFKSGFIDFSSPIAVIPASDPNITSRAEELITAQQVLNEVKQNPLTAQNPQSLYFATKDYFRALRTRDMDRILKMPEPPPPPPDLPPEQENAMLLKDTITPALQNQDHPYHIDTHEGFRNSQWYEQLTPHGKQLHEAHEREHMAFLYLQEEQQRKQLAAQAQQFMGEING